MVIANRRQVLFIGSCLVIFLFWKTQCFTSFITIPNLNDVNTLTVGDEIHEIDVRSVEEASTEEDSEVVKAPPQPATAAEYIQEPYVAELTELLSGSVSLIQKVVKAQPQPATVSGILKGTAEVIAGVQLQVPPGIENIQEGVAEMVGGAAKITKAASDILKENRRRMDGVKQEEQATAGDGNTRGSVDGSIPTFPAQLSTDSAASDASEGKISGICSPEEMLNEIEDFTGKGWCKSVYSQDERHFYLCMNGRESPNYRMECGTIQTKFMVPNMLILFIIWFLFVPMLKKTGLCHYCSRITEAEEDTKNDENTPLTDDQ